MSDQREDKGYNPFVSVEADVLALRTVIAVAEWAEGEFTHVEAVCADLHAPDGPPLGEVILALARRLMLTYDRTGSRGTVPEQVRQEIAYFIARDDEKRRA